MSTRESNMQRLVVISSESFENVVAKFDAGINASGHK
jgi:hypothetical protein